MARIELLPIKQRIAVGLGMRDDFAGHVAAGAGAVIDDEGLAEQFAKLLGHDARQHVAWAARRKADQDRHRPLRVIGGERGLIAPKSASNPAPAQISLLSILESSLRPGR